MKVHHSIEELASIPGPVHLAVGVFDGVHLGHRAVIQTAMNSAHATGGTTVVVTFDPHPAVILRPAQAPAQLTSTRHKLRLLSGLGIQHALVLPFTSKLAATAPADFIISLSASCRPLQQICVGETWAFGKGRAGNVGLLHLLGQTLRFEAAGVASISIDGEVVSSTTIRAAIQRGDLAHAANMLGRGFSVFGTVGEGRKLGRTLGFPTANIRPESEQLPPDGVYAVWVEANGTYHSGVANIGVRPTVEPTAVERSVEVHIFDFEGELVGTDLDVTFYQYLRPEQKFPSIEALKQQIAVDVQHAKEICAAALAAY